MANLFPQAHTDLLLFLAVLPVSASFLLNSLHMNHSVHAVLADTVTDPICCCFVFILMMNKKLFPLFCLLLCDTTIFTDVCGFNFRSCNPQHMSGGVYFKHGGQYILLKQCICGKTPKNPEI